MWLSRGRLDRELDEEMRLHLELSAEEERARGRSPDEARRAARMRFGNVTYHREESRTSWGWRRLDELGGDVRFALRTMRRNPGFAAVAVIALALGIGANTAIFSIVNAVLLRPLPYADSDRLVTILAQKSRPVAPRNFLDWREQARSFAGMGAAEAFGVNLAGIDRPEQIQGLRLTGDMFPMLGVAPLLGRTLLPEENEAGKEHVVVIAHSLWQRRFAADPAVLGRPILLDGVSYTVVGVMPPAFQFTPFWVTDAELWAPLVFGDHAASRSRNSLRVIARLAPGATLEQARAEIAAITARLDAEFPGTNRGLVVTPLQEQVVGSIRPALLVLLGAVAFVLLIACANIAHMLLARAAARQREIAVRTALGAGRGRLIRQFLTESVILAILGAGLGIGLAALGLDALVALQPASIPRVTTVAIDGRVLAVMLAVTVFAGLAFGLLPALAGTSPDARALDAVKRRRLRGLLVSSQVALALVLSVGAGLMIRSFVALSSVDSGWNPDKVVTMTVSVAGTTQNSPERRAVFFTGLIKEVGAIPGVAAASAVNHLPLYGDIWGFSIHPEGKPPQPPGEEYSALYRVVLPGYFGVMRQAIVRGRDVTAADTLDAPAVVVVNQKLAETHWPGQDPIGKRITFDDEVAGPWVTVVGVVADAPQDRWGEPAKTEVFVPFLQSRRYLEGEGGWVAYMTLVVRGQIDAASLASIVRSRVAESDAGVVVSKVKTMDDVVTGAVAGPRFILMVLGLFAGVALLLSAIGIYGVMSHSVARRTQEIGIRVALGATRGNVLGLVLSEGLTSVAGGLLLGLAGAFALSRLMASLLYGVAATDPLTFVAVAGALALVALLACVIPARRATRVDPVTALRHD